MNADTLLLTTIFTYAVVAAAVFLVARFVLSIGRIVRNQDKIIKILSGIAIKMDVDSHHLK